MDASALAVSRRARRPRAARLTAYARWVYVLPLVLVVLLVVVGAAVTSARWRALAPVDAVLPPSWAGSGGKGTLGTDSLGRDVLARVLRGARTSIVVSFAGTALGLVIGIPLAFVASMTRGAWAWLVLRLMDLQLAVPYVILALFIASVVSPSVWLLIILLGLPSWVYSARLVRSTILQELPKEYVLSARLMGASTMRIAWRYLVPQVLPTIGVVAGNLCASLVLLEATLSFLGMGVQPPEPTLGGMMLEGREYLAAAWWVSVFPGVCVFLIVSTLYLAVGGLTRGRSTEVSRVG
jgi:peptide/nickel transport system permease protein